MPYMASTCGGQAESEGQKRLCEQQAACVRGSLAVCDPQSIKGRTANGHTFRSPSNGVRLPTMGWPPDGLEGT
jgi:hypothetical protein